ncbi:alpha-ketoglutarate-dependent dioxygenase AlkB [uncultured Ramlibacter sp.]|uniref:alpha-ketoglutarate-dependent dioxygenase AlkB family protein n=1 Tax=uncultured Ramlibacter sp. TaxID=260755 RepID=UPI00262F0E0F|nr:alpha-ketoglutarate-dependent dioxygenase AlkB [uncultured Ramlibacter sp.]
MTTDMFRDAAGFERVPLEGANVQLWIDFLPRERANSLLQELITVTPWRAEEVVVWGKRHPQPRLIAWYGDTGKNYTYSGIAMNPLSWTPLLQLVRSEVEEACGDRFNSVLLNYYRHERDSMGMHSDNEPELGPRPTIASLSVGEERLFSFKAKDPKVESRSIALPSGSLLLMKGDTQMNWKHGIAKAGRRMGPRVNLTFRQIRAKP